MDRQPAPPAAGDLARLLEAEERLQLLAAEARISADTLIAEAEAESRRIGDATAEACRVAEAGSAARVAADRDRAIAEITARADREIAGLRDLPIATVTRLADTIVRRVLGDPA